MSKISSILAIPFLVSGSDEEPEVSPPTPLGAELYKAVQPLAYEDRQNGHALLHYLDAAIQAAQQAATYGRDTGNTPGWGILMDPDTCPEEALEWLGQLVGVDVASIKRTSTIIAQNLVYVPNFTRTALNAAPALWANADTAATTFKVTEGWVAARKTLEIITAAMASGKTNAALAQGPIKLTGHEHCILVAEKEKYSFRSIIKVGSITGSMSFYGRVRWFNINGEELSSTNVGLAVGTGEHELTGVVTAPPKAVAAEISFAVSESKAAASKATLWLDKCAFSPSPKEEVLPYGDGDTKGWHWTNVAGESSSNETELQSEPEYIAAKRFAVKELSAQQRGTLQAIEATVKRFLTGSRNVFIKERDGGAYKLTVVTYTEETPEPAQLLAALKEQVPGGIILTYNTVSGAAYIIIRAKYASYKAVGEAFKTYNGLRLNLPGT